MSIRSIRFALFAATALAGAAQAQHVAPPPLPIGSALVRPQPGMNEAELKRAERAHHHKFQNGKDYTRDDSVHGHESQVPGAVQPVGTRAPAGAVQGGPAAAGTAGGAGTGPAREQTDKGAASYYFGNDKK
jgi:hypothetical protein